jgi:hypothetical protein
MIISHVKIIAFQLSLLCKNYRFSQTVLYIINRKIHGCLEIPDLFLVFAALTREISCSTLEINLVFPRTHVLFSISFPFRNTETARFLTLRTRFLTLRTRFLALRTRFLALRTRFLTLRTRFLTLRTRFLALRTRFLALRTRFLTLRTWFVPGAEDKVSDAEDKVPDAEDKVRSWR